MAARAGYARALGVAHLPSHVHVQSVLLPASAKFLSRTPVTLRPASTVLRAILNRCTNMCARAASDSQVTIASDRITAPRRLVETGPGVARSRTATSVRVHMVSRVQIARTTSTSVRGTRADMVPATIFTDLTDVCARADTPGKTARVTTSPVIRHRVKTEARAISSVNMTTSAFAPKASEAIIARRILMTARVISVKMVPPAWTE